MKLPLAGPAPTTGPMGVSLSVCWLRRTGCDKTPTAAGLCDPCADLLRKGTT